MNYYLEAFRKYTVFSGRATRKEYWMFYLVDFLVYIIIEGIAYGSLLYDEQSVVGIVLTGLFCIYALAVTIPTLAITVRRLHDIGHSGWWLLIAFLPFFGGLILFAFSIMDSTPGENIYGPNPKEVQQTM